MEKNEHLLIKGILTVLEILFAILPTVKYDHIFLYLCIDGAWRYLV